VPNRESHSVTSILALASNNWPISMAMEVITLMNLANDEYAISF